MRKFVLLSLAFLLLLPAASYAIGLEVGLGGWRQSPEGTLSYNGFSIPANDLDLERDLKYDTETKVTGRVKIDMPLIIPNVYLMYTPMSFKGTGQKDASFQFGGQIYNASVPFTSELTFDHYDIALFYSIPFLKTATMGKLNVELGINARIVDFEAKVDQESSNTHESKSYTLPVPMIYVGAQIKPVKSIAIEGEARGVAYSGNSLYSLIGRLKVKPFGPLFIAGGYRYDTLKIDEKDVKADVKFSGPFAEAGLEF